jgi:hypothetical protein
MEPASKPIETCVTPMEIMQKHSRPSKEKGGKEADEPNDLCVNEEVVLVLSSDIAPLGER